VNTIVKACATNDLQHSAPRVTITQHGLTSQKLVVKESRRARRKATVNFLIDSEAVYSLVPAQTLRRLGVRPHREVDFSLAGGLPSGGESETRILN